MTDRLEEIKVREKKATKGEWYQHCQPCGPCAQMCYHETVESNLEYPSRVICHRPTSRIKGSIGKSQQTFDDMIFIAHARQDIPWLISEVERLEKLVKFLNERNEALSKENEGLK